MKCENCGFDKVGSAWMTNAEGTSYNCPKCGYVQPIVDPQANMPDESTGEISRRLVEVLLGVKLSPTDGFCPRCKKRHVVMIADAKPICEESWTGHGLCAPCMYAGAMDLARRAARERDAMRPIMLAAMELHVAMGDTDGKAIDLNDYGLAIRAVKKAAEEYGAAGHVAGTAELGD